jgi:hypothetical protein
VNSKGERKKRKQWTDLSGLSPEEKRAHKRRYDKQWRKENPDKVLKHATDRHDRMKRKVIEAYGGKCECCEETDLHFLTIDHVAGFVPDEHKFKSGRRISGTAFLALLEKEGFPDTCRVLCWNCNCSRAYYGFCPHQSHDISERRYT